MKPAAERLAAGVWIVASVKLLAHLRTTGRFGDEYFGRAFPCGSGSLVFGNWDDPSQRLRGLQCEW